MKKKSNGLKKTKLDNLIIFIIIIFIIGGVGIYYALSNKDLTPPKNEGTEPVPEKKVSIVNLESKSRPYAVTINNIGAARGVQSGLQDAYIIYDIGRSSCRERV